MWMALMCLWKRDYLPPCSSLSFTRSFILMQFLWISVRQISRICSFHFIAKIRIILFPHYSSLHILNNLNLDLSWSNFVLSNLIKKKQQTCSESNNMAVLYLTSSLQCQPRCLKMSNYRSHSPFIWRFRT